MPDPVTVDHGGLSVTTNTASEADLRAELTAGDAPPADAPTPQGRNDRGQFTRREATTEPATPPAELPAEDEAEAAPEPQRRKDDSLPRHNPIARLNQALAQKVAAEHRAAQLEAALAEIQRGAMGAPAPPAPPPPTGTGEPQFESFADQPDPYTAYLQAWARWDNSRLLEERFAAYDAAQRSKGEQATFESRIAEGRSAHADWDEALTQAATLGLQVSEVMRAAITSSPRAADLVHYLATHPEECTQLAEESIATPVAAVTVMRRLLESQVAAPVAAPHGGTGTTTRPVVSTAKPPVKPVGSSPVVGDDPPGESASAAEHARYWNRKLKVPGTPR